jgi:hypothetical protein
VTGLWRRWIEFWFAELPATRLAAFQQAILFTLVFYLLERWRFAGEWLTTAGFHPSPAVDPVYAPQVPLVPEGWLAVVGVLLFGSIALAIFGAWRRAALAVAFVGVVAVSHIDPISAFTLNRLYMFVLLVLLLAPPVRDGRQAAWPVRMLQIHLLVHYAAAGACKLRHGDWIGHTDVLWMQVQGIYMTDAAAWMIRTLPGWAWTGLQHAALGFELAAPLLFMVRRLRPVGIVVGGLHLVVALTMYQLIYFSLQMMCFYVLFLDAGTLERWQARLGLRRR